MTTQTVEVTNKIGFHARPASLLISAAKRYSSSFLIQKGDASSDLRSIVTLMKLKVKNGDMISISADGADEEQAVQELVDLVKSKFGEE